MDKKTRLIIIGILSIIIVILLSLGLTKAFMKPIEQGGNLTEISLESCAKIKLTGTSSINLSSSYPMSRNRGLQTTPYSLTVTSYCDSYVGFNLYIATLNTNTLTDENIHYILTEKGSKTAVVEGVLSSATDGSSDFSDTDKTELNTGLKGTYSKIYKIHNTSVALKGNKQYDLYLFVDETSTNTSMNKTFKAGVAVKAYDREKDQTLAEYVISQYTGTQGENGIYYHNSALTNGAGDNSYRYAGASDSVNNYIGDNSYRYAGASDSVNNYICLGSDKATCPDANLFRIIGVFGAQTKVIRAKSVGNKEWDTNDSNTWSSSSLNTYLNGEYLTSLGTIADKIAITTWKVGGGSWSNIVNSVPKTAYKNEVGSSASSTTYGAKIGLMYVSDYYYSASPSAQTKVIIAKSVGDKEWDTNGYNTWSSSSLNTYLNGTYLTSLGTIADKIATTTWKVGGNTSANISGVVPKTAYQYEVGSSASTTTYDAKIGLMYVTDYYYSASPSAWTLVGYNESDATKDYRVAKTTNWLYLGSSEWTISRGSGSTYGASNVTSTGYVLSNLVTSSFGVRPSFNLLSSVTYASGSGTSSDPIRIN
ncbi:unknown [Firmicutes bacterium CAG:460]|nr:unknown [Firmicutes bacterium CAG:460]